MAKIELIGTPTYKLEVTQLELDIIRTLTGNCSTINAPVDIQSSVYKIYNAVKPYTTELQNDNCSTNIGAQE